jgi:hemolysin activation/secretion protein
MRRCCFLTNLFIKKAPIRTLFIIFYAVAPNAYAQNIPDSVTREAQRIQERELERARARENLFLQSQITPPSGLDISTADNSYADSKRCIRISAVTISGMSRYNIGEFDNNAQKLIGPCTQVAAVDEVLRSITNKYVGDGYITSRAIIAPEKSSDAVLNIIVIEGTLNNIIGSADEKQPIYGGELALAFPGMKRRWLNLRDIEQGVDQLSRLGGSEPQIDIIPGTTVGTSDLVVRRQRNGSWLRPSFSFNNDGSAGTGRHQGTASLDIDSPLGLADFWSLYYLRDLERSTERSAEGFGGFFSLPYGYTTLTLSGGQYRFATILRSNGLTFSNTGASTNGSITLDQLLLRDSRTKVSVSGSFSVYDTSTRIQDIRLSTNSYRLATGAISFRLQRRISQGVALFEVSVTRGFNIIGANAADFGPGSDGLSFRKIETSLAYQTRVKLLGVLTAYHATFRGQVALDPVLPAERFSIGGSSTVRGFRDDGLSGRVGAVFRQQFEIGLFKLFSEAKKNTASQLSALFGYDAGGIAARNEDLFERGFLHSATLGLRLINRRIQTEISVSAPLSAPQSVQKHRFEFAASARLTL